MTELQIQKEINQTLQIMIAEQAKLILRQEKEIEWLIRTNITLEKEMNLSMAVILDNPMARCHRKEARA